MQTICLVIQPRLVVILVAHVRAQLPKGDGTRRGHVERIDPVRHRNTHGSVAARDSLGAQAGTLGAHKDRHARIGEGRIGKEALAAVVMHPRLLGLPCILETPNELPGYAEEIAFFRSCVV